MILVNGSVCFTSYNLEPLGVYLLTGERHNRRNGGD